MKKELVEWQTGINILTPGSDSCILSLVSKLRFTTAKDPLFTGEISLGLMGALNDGENFLSFEGLKERIIAINVAGSPVWRHFEKDPENHIPYSWKDQGYTLYFRNLFKGVNSDAIFIPYFTIHSSGVWKSGLQQIVFPFAPPKGRKARFVCII